VRAARHRSGRGGRVRRRGERRRAPGGRGPGRGGRRRRPGPQTDRRMDGAERRGGRGRGLPGRVSRLTSLMLDVRQIRADPEGTKTALARRGEEAVRDVDEFLAADARRLELLARVEAARAERNAAAKAIAEAKQRGEDAAAE